MGQGSADWFILRKFRITETMSARVLLSADGMRNFRGMGRTIGPQNNRTEWMEELDKGWFTNRRNTEPMLQGTVNERSIFNALSSLPFVHEIDGCGIIVNASERDLDCSFKSIDLLDISNMELDCTW